MALHCQASLKGSVGRMANRTIFLLLPTFFGIVLSTPSTPHNQKNSIARSSGADVITNCTYSLKAEYTCSVPGHCTGAEQGATACSQIVAGRWSDEDEIVHWEGYCSSVNFAKCSFALNGTYWCHEPALGDRITFWGEYIGDAKTGFKRAQKLGRQIHPENGVPQLSDGLFGTC